MIPLIISIIETHTIVNKRLKIIITVEYSILIKKYIAIIIIYGIV